MHFAGSKSIYVDPRLRGRTLLEVLIHETQHYARPDESEEQVNEIARIHASLLWKDGWRRIQA